MAEKLEDFCLRRAEEERERAASSESPDVAQRHLEMARLYELRISDPVTWASLSTQETGQHL